MDVKKGENSCKSNEGMGVKVVKKWVKCDRKNCLKVVQEKID